jgi:hypothetical protein
VYRIYLAQDEDKQWAVARAKMILRVPKDAGIS